MDLTFHTDNSSALQCLIVFYLGIASYITYFKSRASLSTSVVGSFSIMSC